MLQLQLQLPMFIFILCFIWHLQADARWPSSLVSLASHLSQVSLSLSLSWAQEQRIHLVITWHLNGSGRYQSPVYLNSNHMLLKTVSILQRYQLAEREIERRQFRLSSPWTRTDCIPSRIRRFNPFFVMSSALKHTICLSPGTDGMREIERERESPLCSVPHLELKKTLRKTQSSSELPSFACVLWIFQHFQEYLQCLPYNKHSVKCFSFSLPLPLPLSPLSHRFFLLLGWSFLQFDWNRELV